ncbi:MAG: hypothetical protein IIB94_05840 [Candidatus Marinimicrobia bacterium]|nr:hypothetical protein [Candidatus Neomarinimicrobiota bacterium]
MNFHLSKTINSAINFRYRLLIFPLIVVLSGCDSIVFENKIDTILDPVDHVNYLSVSSASISDTTWTKTPKRDKAVRLFIGKLEGYESAALLRFEYLDTLVDTVGIDTLRLELTVNNTIGVESGSPKLLSLYWNRNEWKEEDLPDSSLIKFDDFVPDPLDLLDTATVVWVQSDTIIEKIIFDIPLESLQNWIGSSDKHGFIILSDSVTNFMISSPARESSLSASLPRLQVIDEDTTNAESIFATENGYLLSITTGLPLSDPSRTYIGGGEAYRGIYKFNSGLLDNISETSKISSAELNIAYDSLRSILPNKNSSATGIGFTLYFSYLDSSSENDSLFPTAAGDSTSASIPIDGNIISFNITNILQRWVAEKFNDRGLVIWSGNEGSQLFRVALYSDSCDDNVDASCVEPELNVYYMTSEAIEK